LPQPSLPSKVINRLKVRLFFPVIALGLLLLEMTK
jgi:hypothetical protein